VNKPFPPSARKLKKAREDGDLVKSADFSKAIIFAVGIIYLFCSSAKLSRLGDLTVESLTLISGITTDSNVSQELFSFLNRGLTLGLELVLPLFGIIVATAVLAGILQVGFYWQTKLLVPNLTKFNPVKNLKKLLSLNEEGSEHNIFLAKIIYDIFKISLTLLLLLVVGYWIVSFYLANLGPGYDWMGLLILFKHSLKILAPILILICGVVGILDLALERRRRTKRLQMDLEELKKEFKETEGNPEIISLRKQLQREIALQNILQNIRKSKVLIVNK
jgi:type III secretion protein U